MKKDDSIFVYGTLRRGERADLTKQFYAYGVDLLGPDRINGKLYHLGSFPGVKLSALGDFDPAVPVVVGEAFRIHDASIVAILDAYEGYQSENPTTGLYDRCQIQTERGRTVWVYTFNGMVIPEQQIESGDWCKNRQTSVNARRLRE